MQNNPELCERCNVVHTQEPVDVEKVAVAALETIVEAENAEWRKMVDTAMEGPFDEMQLMRALGIDAKGLEMFEGDTLAGEALRITSERAETWRNYFDMYPHQREALARIQRMGPMPVICSTIRAEIPRDHSSGIFAGLCEGIFPHTHQGYTRGVFRSKHPQLSQIPKSPEARKLMRDRNETFGLRYGQQTQQEGEFLPKRDPTERIMFMVDSYPSDMIRELDHTFEHDPRMTLMLDAAHRCGKTRMTGEMFDEFGRGVRGFAGPPGPAGPTEIAHVRTPTLKALDDYHYRSARDIYDGTPGRPKGSKEKRKAQKAARKGNRK